MRDKYDDTGDETGDFKNFLTGGGGPEHVTIDNIIYSWIHGAYDSRYYSRFKEVIQKQQKSIIVDYNDIINTTQFLTAVILSDPAYFIESFLKVLRQIDEEIDTSYLKDNKYFSVRILNYPIFEKISHIDESHNQQLRSFRGYISKMSERKPYIYRFYNKCPECGNERYTEYSDVDCDRCDSGPRMKGNKNKNIYTSCHYIKIQELNEDLEGRVPAQIDCTVLGDLTQYVKAGIKVRATGFVALKEIFNTMSVHTPYTLTVDLNNLDPLLTNNLESMQKAAITEMDERKIWEMARDKVRLFETLLGSFAPHIFGHEFIKLGLMLSIVGSGRIKVNEVTIRDRIHTMLVGDPGVSKSQLLKFGEKVTMGSIYSSGRGVSGGGLTALTLKEKDGSFSIQPGALIFANNSVFWFDEADKTTDETKSHLHESMEDGTVSLIKGGQMATLQALTTVVFGANPRYSRYQEDMSIVENINMPDSLISRFDLIYIIKDTVNEALDRRISSHIAHILMKRTIPTYGSVVLEISDLIKYITYVKRQDLDPDITEGALKKFQDFYVDMRKKSTVDTLAITPRQFQAMLRLSRALARLLLDDKVTEYYADRIIDLMRYQLDNVMKDADGNYNVAQPQGKTASALKGSKLVIKVMKDLEADYDKDKIPKQKIRGILTSDYNMDTKEIDRLLDKMNADGLILHNGGQQFVRLG